MPPGSKASAVSARTRYVTGTREILDCWFAARPIRDEYLIVEGGILTGTEARSYTIGAARKAAAAPRK
jgi:formate dehydrogenase